jgi:taurine dioxygenase
MEYSALAHSPFGLSVDIDPGQKLSKGERMQLKLLLIEHDLMVIRDQQFSDNEHVSLAGIFGRVEPDETGEPFLMRVTNQYEDSSAPQGKLGFHFDYCYDPRPVNVITMYGSEIVAGVTPTYFVSSTVLVEQLPLELYSAIKGREAAHCCFPMEFSHKFLQANPGPDIARGLPGWNSEYWWMRKPIFEDRAGGRLTLYICELYTHSIIGLPEDESLAILKELYQCLYHVGRQYQHQWQPDDMVIWDNLRVQHARPTHNNKQRTLRRFHTAEDNLTEDYLRVGRENEYL